MLNRNITFYATQYVSFLIRFTNFIENHSENMYTMIIPSSLKCNCSKEKYVFNIVFFNWNKCTSLKFKQSTSYAWWDINIMWYSFYRIKFEILFDKMRNP